ncbi:lantibiotic dehydratase [Streptomyces sp. NPDC059828]|uniref:lantibiotic dehydratase n=1 Tax=Streptomyces sp. NPDC059828 TaxID=3346965 RepID=UPI00364C208B
MPVRHWPGGSTTFLAAGQPRPRDVRRAVLSVARYLLRAHGRPTPFGSSLVSVWSAFPVCVDAARASPCVHRVVPCPGPPGLYRAAAQTVRQTP